MFHAKWREPDHPGKAFDDLDMEEYTRARAERLGRPASSVPTPEEPIEPEVLEALSVDDFRLAKAGQLTHQEARHRAGLPPKEST